MMTTQPYGMRITLPNSYEESIEKVTAALKTEGFGVLTSIDVKEVMRQKFGKDFRKYVILGACNPNLSYQAFSDEIEVGLLLPCNVIVYEENGGTAVAILDPGRMLGVSGNPKLEDVASQAKEKLQRVIQALDINRIY